MWEPYIEEVTLKEVLNINGKGDVQWNNVPTTWKQSIQYQGTDKTTQRIYPQWDKDQDIIANKLPRNYVINLIHMPTPQ